MQTHPFNISFALPRKTGPISVDRLAKALRKLVAKGGGTLNKWPPEALDAMQVRTVLQDHRSLYPAFSFDKKLNADGTYTFTVKPK